MLKRDWDGAPAFGLGVAFLAVFALGWWAADYDSQKARDTYNAAEQRADDPDSKRYEPCFALLPASPYAAFECVVDQARASREAQTAQYDLSAQQSMAESANRLIVVTIVLSLIGFVITAVGIVFVWRTLRATRKANRIARLSAERQLRAYITVKESHMRKMTPGGVPAAHMLLTNTGQTPAYGYNVAHKLVYSPFPIPEEVERDISKEPDVPPGPPKVLGPGNPSHASPKLSRVVTAEDLEHVHAGRAVFVAVIHVKYTDAFGEERWLRSRAYYGGGYGTTETGAMVTGGEEAN